MTQKSHKGEWFGEHISQLILRVDMLNADNFAPDMITKVVVLDVNMLGTVKNIASMAIMSHKDCGLDYSPMSQMVRSHVKKLANEIDVLDQSEEGLHQRKGNKKNRISKWDE